MGKNMRGITTRLWIVILLLFGFSNNFHAQQQTVSGTVTDAGTTEILPGVNVLVKGIMTGTSNDSEGNYELTLLIRFYEYGTSL